jgi:acyl dehydratase
MPLSTDALGRVGEPQIREIDLRSTLAYAAAIGDANPHYLDDASPEGVVAPPAFCVSLEWPPVQAIGRLAGLGLTREEALRGVHAFQDSTFHRPIRPGDRLRTVATLVELRAIRPGALLVSRLDTADEVTGEPVVTSYYGSIYRGVGVEGEGGRIDAAPALPDEPPSGPTEKAGIAIAREAPHVYTECARIWNPIHTERGVALAAGLPDIILHGTATWALAGREIIDRFAAGDPLRLERLVGRFAAMVIPGFTIEFEAARTRSGAVFSVRNERGEEALSGGWAVLRGGV